MPYGICPCTSLLPTRPLSFEAHQNRIYLCSNLWASMNRFIVAYCLCATSTAVLLWLWRRQCGNYVWLLRNIFVPGMFNGLSGLITTFVSVYATQKNPAGPTFGASSISTLVVTSACMFICSFLAAIYTLLKLRAYKVPARQEPRKKEK